MNQKETLVVVGLKELIHAADASSKDIKKAVRSRLREVGTKVRDDARDRLTPLNPGSADTLRVVVRRTGVIAVEQSQHRVTGKRPDWGRTQMRDALEPALHAKEGEAVRELEQAVEDIRDRYWL